MVTKCQNIHYNSVRFPKSIFLIRLFQQYLADVLGRYFQIYLGNYFSLIFSFYRTRTFLQDALQRGPENIEPHFTSSKTLL